MPASYTLKKLQEKIEEIYLIKDPYITKVMAASVIAHFISSDPCWIVIVAPSGGAKSEFVNLLHLIKWTPPGEGESEQSVHSMSTLTSKTFISGQKVVGRDSSLLLQISNGIITFKDLTSLLSEHKEDRAVIMAQLREIYDGRYVKSFGTGETLEWQGKITIIAGATFAIHGMKQAYTAMGERFVFYNMIQPEGLDAARRTMQNQEEGKMMEHRVRLAGDMKDYILEVLNHMPSKLPRITKEQQDMALDLAELATRARSDVQRNWSSREQEITEVFPPEMPTRFAGQLQTMLRALEVINFHETGDAKLLPEDEKILAKLALDSITRSRRIAMIELSRYDILETTGIATKIGMPTNSVRRWVEDLTALEIAEREKGSGPKGDRWKIKMRYRNLIMKYEDIQREGKELTSFNAEPNEQQVAEAQTLLAEEESELERHRKEAEESDGLV